MQRPAIKMEYDTAPTDVAVRNRRSARRTRLNA